MKRQLTAVFSTLALGVAPSVALAHPSVVSGPAFADKTQEVHIGVGHGCEGMDTYKLRVAIPPEISSLRPMTSDFGKFTIERDAANKITAVTWQKAADVLAADEGFYKLVLRIRAPNTPFSTLLLRINQTCRAVDGTETVVDWIADTETADGPEPASPLVILPPRRTGWNKYTVPADVTEMAKYFDDAQIVWKDGAAYSANPATAEQIANTEGVTALTELAAGDEIWVKY